MYQNLKYQNFSDSYNHMRQIKSDNNEQNKFMADNNKTEKHILQKLMDAFQMKSKFMVWINGKIRQVQISLHPYRQNFLCLSQLYDMFVIDLCFTSIHFSEKRGIANLNSDKKYLCLEQFNGLIILLFETQSKAFQVFSILTNYKKILNKKYPQYLICNSTLVKSYMKLERTISIISHQEEKWLSILKQFRQQNTQCNQDILKFCFNELNSKNFVECFNQYLMIQFCYSYVLLEQFNSFSSKKLSNITQNPKAIFHKIMKKQEFYNFLQKIQREQRIKAIQILSKFNQFLSFYDFCYFLFNQEINYVAKAEQVDQNYPLTKYFCYSSHNTYLSGNQLTSKSLKQRYTEDFQTGVKCVQIDIHKGGEVTHAFLGLSLTNSLQFEEVIKQIYQYRQSIIRNGQTHYPIILSLQNHVPTLKRQTLISVLAKYFDNDCYYMNENDKQFPTLAQLKNRVIVKTSTKIVQTNIFKLIKQKSIQTIIQSSQSQSSQSQQSESNNSSYPLSERINQFKNYHLQNNFYLQKAKSKRKNFLRKIRKHSTKKSPHEPMVTVTGIFKSKNGIQNNNPNSFVCTSLTAKKALKKKPQKILKYTKNSWLRIYPKNSSIRSSNYNPANFLQLGAQLIALNTQTKDDHALMMHCYFSAGRAYQSTMFGYILKPKYLLQQCYQNNNLTYLHISVIKSFGHNVKLKFIGVDQDMERNHKSRDTFVLKYYNQSFIIIEIGSVAKQCIAVRFLREGYRVIIGRNPKTFKDMGIRILILIKKQIYFTK